MSHYKPYPTYKDSGVEWLGQVPEHWIVSRLRHITNGSLSYGANEAAESDDLRHPRFIRITDLNEDGTLRDDTFKSLPPDVARPYLLKDGDILLARSGATVGKSFLYRRDMGDACYAGYLIRARLLESKFIPKLFWYCTQSSYYWDFIAGSNIQATIQNVSGEKYSNLWLAVPPVTEQRSIVSNLDRETARIDALIEKKARFIELLREKRQALITHAVTKGLDPNVEMKDSGVEWLGGVPEHWEVRSVSSVSTKITNGYVGPTRDILVEEGVRYLQSLHIKGNQIKFDIPYFVTEEWSNQHRKSILETGDVLIVQTGDIGQVTVVTDEFAGCNCHALIIVAPERGIIAGEWMSWVFNSSYGYHTLLSIQTGAMHPHLNCGNVKDVLLPVPPLTEQREIMKHIEHEERRVAALSGKTERSIELLKERRSALITAAVTGQIDLREAL